MPMMNPSVVPGISAVANAIGHFLQGAQRDNPSAASWFELPASDQPTITVAQYDGASAAFTPVGLSISSLTWTTVGSDHVVTAVTSAPHGMTSGRTAVISGANGADYNRTAQITVTAPNKFTYLIGPSAYPTTPDASTAVTVYARPVHHAPLSGVFRYSVPEEALAGTSSSWHGIPGVSTRWTESQYNFVGYWVEFTSRETAVDIVLSGGARPALRITVDGKSASAGLVYGGANSYPFHYYSLKFASPAERVIRLYISGETAFHGVWAENPGSIRRPRSPRRTLALAFSDSFGEGTGAAWADQGFLAYLCAYLGWDLINYSAGGQGMLAGGAGGVRESYPPRIGRAAALYRPDVIILHHSVNDGSSVTYQSSIDLIRQAKSAWPQARIVVIGQFAPTESVNPANLASTLALKDACASEKVIYCDGGIGAIAGRPNWIRAANRETYYGGTAATANASIAAGAVSAIAVATPGSGYDKKNALPTVTLSGGGGSGASAAVVLNERVTDVQILRGGSGYASAPAVTLTCGGAAIAAPAWGAWANGVGNVIVTDPGRNYSKPPKVTFTGGGGSGASATAVIDGGKIVRIDVTASGSGYTSAPTVSISECDTQATAVAVVTNGVLTGINITNPGSGYTSTPLVVIAHSSASGQGALAVAHLSSVVESISVINGGSGYTSAPTVVIAHPTGGDPTHPKTEGHRMLAEFIGNDLISNWS